MDQPAWPSAARYAVGGVRREPGRLVPATWPRRPAARRAAPRDRRRGSQHGRRGDESRRRIGDGIGHEGERGLEQQPSRDGSVVAEGHAVGTLPGSAVAGDRHPDRTPVDLPPGVDAQLGQRPWPAALDDHVGGGDQAPERVPPGAAAKVERHRGLAAVQEVEESARPLPCGVGPTGGLDLHHPTSRASQEVAAQGSRPERTQFDDERGIRALEDTALGHDGEGTVGRCPRHAQRQAQQVGPLGQPGTGAPADRTSDGPPVVPVAGLFEQRRQCCDVVGSGQVQADRAVGRFEQVRPAPDRGGAGPSQPGDGRTLAQQRRSVHLDAAELGQRPGSGLESGGDRHRYLSGWTVCGAGQRHRP